MYAEPPEPDAESDDAPDDQDPGAEVPEVGIGAEEEEEHDLDGEADAVCEEDDAVDRPVRSGEGEDGVVGVGRGLGEEVLEGGRGEVEEG